MTDIDMEIINAALYQAFWCNLTIQDVAQISEDSLDPLDFAAKVNEFAGWTEEPAAGVVLIDLSNLKQGDDQ